MAAKKSSPSKSKKTPVSKKAEVSKKTVTSVRNTPLPKVSTKKSFVPTEADVAKRAFEIACGGTGGNELDNWYRAERELKAGL